MLRAKRWRGRYQDAVLPPPGISVWVVPPTARADDSCYYARRAHLLFAALAPADRPLAVLSVETITPDRHAGWGSRVVVPVRRVYFVISSVTLHRLSDGLPVRQCSIFTRSARRRVLDVGTSMRTARLTGRGTGRPRQRVRPGRAGRRATTASAFRVMLAENIGRERIFGGDAAHPDQSPDGDAAPLCCALCAGDDLQQRRDAHRAAADGQCRSRSNGIPLG